MEYSITLANTEVRDIAIRSRHSHTGARIGHAPGAEFIIKNSNPDALAATIVTNTAGNPALRLRPIVDEAEEIEIDVLDNVGSASIELTVDIVARNFGAELELDMDNSSSEPQSPPSEAPVKPNPGEAETQPVGSTATIDPGVAVGGPAVVGPEKGDGGSTTAEPGAETQPGMAMQEPAGSGSVADKEAEKARQEEAAKAEGQPIHEGDSVQLNKDHPEGA